MTPADWVLDGAIATTLPLLGFRVVRAPELNHAIVLFVAFGLMSALAWTRLGAVDVALVEASLGTGLSSALLMSALSWASPGSPAPAAHRRWVALLTVGLGACLVPLVLELPVVAGLTSQVADNLHLAGVSQPVTAVLMNFRGYDTLLETIVLLVAAISVRSIQREPSPTDAAAPSELLRTFAKLLLPVGVLLAGYLVWRGSTAPGGAFQAGAVLAGGGVVQILANNMRPPQLSSRMVRTYLIVGPAVFLVLASGPLLVGGRLLELPADWAGALTFAVEVALVISIALVLVMFFPASTSSAAGAGAHQGRRER
ncbi:MAG TPA: hydrogenase subunit MbhD domain-containing protein [Labilithrix sp.]|nr:hydrogenase subunit MbhD domain-containing protein [Labilithrix sp.]